MLTINAQIQSLNSTTDESQNLETVQAIGDALSEQVGKHVNLNKVTKRDASILMIAFGADDYAVSQYAGKVAARMRSNRFTHGSWGATI